MLGGVGRTGGTAEGVSFLTGATTGAAEADQTGAAGAADASGDTGGVGGIIGWTEPVLTATATQDSSVRYATALRLTNAGCFIPPWAVRAFTSKGLLAGSSFLS